MKPLLTFIQFSVFLFLLILPVQAFAQISGCTDSMSLNYNSMATQNDGSCTYQTSSVLPKATFPLGSEVKETSGLIFWNGKLWTHNDNDDTNLYALSPSDGSIVETYPLPGITNTDWEAISQDENYIYIGDFGNNTRGNRTDLKIYKILKKDLLAGTVQAEIINFTYEDQTDFSASKPNGTDFDCEAFIVSSSEIFLFTKQWQSQQTAVYSLSKEAGDRLAKYEGTIKTYGMITDATYMESERLIVLSGYSPLLQPFLFLLYDFKETDFITGNKRKINLELPFHQIESITTENGKEYYLTNEYFNFNQAVEVPQKLHHVDLGDYLTS